MNYRMTMAGLLATGALVLTGCSAAYSESGTVSAKEVDLECKVGKKGKAAKCHTEYEIDLVRADGSVVEVKAHSREDFDACTVGARFPACVKEGQ